MKILLTSFRVGLGWIVRSRFIERVLNNKKGLSLFFCNLFRSFTDEGVLKHGTKGLSNNDYYDNKKTLISMGTVPLECPTILLNN